MASRPRSPNRLPLKGFFSRQPAYSHVSIWHAIYDCKIVFLHFFFLKKLYEILFHTHVFGKSKHPGRILIQTVDEHHFISETLPAVFFIANPPGRFINDEKIAINI